MIDSDIYLPLDWKTNFKKVAVTGLGKVGDEDAYVVTFEPEKGTHLPSVTRQKHSCS